MSQKGNQWECEVPGHIVCEVQVALVTIVAQLTDFLPFHILVNVKAQSLDNITYI